MKDTHSLQWAHVGLVPAVLGGIPPPTPAFRLYSETLALVILPRPASLLGVRNNERRNVSARHPTKGLTIDAHDTAASRRPLICDIYRVCPAPAAAPGFWEVSQRVKDLKKIPNGYGGVGGPGGLGDFKDLERF